MDLWDIYLNPMYFILSSLGGTWGLVHSSSRAGLRYELLHWCLYLNLSHSMLPRVENSFFLKVLEKGERFDKNYLHH